MVLPKILVLRSLCLGWTREVDRDGDAALVRRVASRVRGADGLRRADVRPGTKQIVRIRFLAPGRGSTGEAPLSGCFWQRPLPNK